MNHDSIRKRSRNFRDVASRFLKSDFTDFSSNLERFSQVIESDDVLLGYLNAVVAHYVDRHPNHRFERDGRGLYQLPIDPDDEAAYIWLLLNHLRDNGGVSLNVFGYGQSNKLGDKVSGFLSKVVQPLVHHLTRQYELALSDSGDDDTSGEDSTSWITTEVDSLDIFRVLPSRGSCDV